MGLWLLALGSFTPEFWGRRSTQTGTNAVIATLAMVVILGLVNFLGVRYGQRIDLTENQLFTLSPQSQQVVKNLEQPMKVWLFTPNPNPDDRELLENYRRYGSNLQFQFVDPQLEPTLAEKFKINSVGEVYLEYGADRQLLQTVDQTERLSEVRLTNGIERLTSDRTDTVYFLQGHGERPLEQVEGGLSLAVQALEEKNFTVQPLSLADRAEVPEDASLVVIAGPKRALLEQEVQALRNYLSTGGSVLLMVDPDSNPGLDSLLADWGISLDSRIAIDASGPARAVGLGPALSLVTNYGDHPITKEFGNNYSLYPLARPLEIKPVEGVKETPLVLTGEESWAESTPEAQPLEFNQETGDRPGPLPLAVALSRKAQPASASPAPKAQPTASPTASPSPSPNGTPQASASPTTSPSPFINKTPEASPTPNADVSASPTVSPSPKEQPKASPKNEKADEKSEARLVVFGNSNFATDGWFEQQLNSDVLLNSVGWLSQRDEQALSIRPKEQRNRRLNLTQAQAIALGWTALLLVPLAGFTTAGVMWWRRR